METWGAVQVVVERWSVHPSCSRVMGGPLLALLCTNMGSSRVGKSAAGRGDYIS